MQTKKRNKINIHGFLNLYKPKGISSNQALGKIKRIFSPKKVGHGGTLDVLAEGVLPIAFGEATKTLQFILDGDKQYEFTLEFGYETETLDAEGEITIKKDKIPTKEEILTAIPNFIGDIEQIPPLYSALKFEGKNAYALARAGIEVDMEKKRRTIKVYNLELLEYKDNTVKLRADVSKGTYIRTLGVDLARSIDSAATIVYLERTKAKTFEKNDAISLERLDEMKNNGHNVQDLLQNVDVVLDDIPVFTISNECELALRNGQIMFVLQDIGLHRIYNEDHTLLSIVENFNGQIKILRNFNL